jgi:hypothetical protein
MEKLASIEASNARAADLERNVRANGKLEDYGKLKDYVGLLQVVSTSRFAFSRSESISSEVKY